MEKYPHPVIDFTKYITPISELKELAERINTCDLKRKVRIKKEKINTIGELKKHITNYEIIEKLFKFLDEGDYVYIYNWFQDKEMGYPSF
jgi:hypothetical protein